MIFLLNLIKIEIKRVLRFLPHIVVGALALCFIIGIISFSAGKTLYEKKDKNKVNIALSIPKDEKAAELMISVVKNMKSIKDNCNFIEVDSKEAAYKKVEKGEAYGAIIIPKHFVSDIMDGTNTPATVLLPNNSSIDAMLIKDLIDAGTKSLSSSQAGIYTVFYEYEEAYHERLTKALQDNINLKYFDYTLQRENFFNHNRISATGELTAMEYYICSGIVLFMLLLGMSFSKYLSPSNNAFYEKLKAQGISKEIVAVTRIISVYIVYMMITIIGLLIYGGICKYLDIEVIKFTIEDYLILLFIILCISSFIVCIYNITESQISGTLLIFTITIIMNFISGGFIPTVFLPKFIQSIAPYTLTNVLSKLLGNIILEQFDSKEFLLALVMLVIIYGITAIVIRLKEKTWTLSTIFMGDKKQIKNFKELLKRKVGK